MITRPHWQPYVTETPIAYDKRLIGQLEDEHRNLLELLADIGATFAARDVTRTALSLHQFKNEVDAHVLTERTRLHPYLEQAFAHDGATRTLLRNLLHGMSQIDRNVLRFLDKYKALGTMPDLHAGFASDHNQISTILIQHIKREESALHPLYLPPWHTV